MYMYTTCTNVHVYYTVNQIVLTIKTVVKQYLHVHVDWNTVAIID